MKKRNILVSGLISASISMNTIAYADTGTSSTGKIHVTEVTTINPENPDPEDPEGEIIDPGVPDSDGSRFKVLFAADWDFGKVEASSRGQVVNAQTLDVMTSTNEELVKRVPWVTTYDMRNSSERTAWNLEVSATQLEDGSGHVLRGAKISINNLHYAAESERAPKAKTGKITLSEIPQALTSASVFSGEGTQDTGVGSWALAIGYKTDDEHYTDGIELLIPSNIVINDSVEYTSTITWNLAITP